MRVLLIGASGFVGSRVLDDLISAGHEVIAQVHSERSRSEIQSMHVGIPVVTGDVGSPSEMRRAIPSGLQAVIYLPGLLREFPGNGVTFQSVHVDGVRNLIKVGRESGATRWIQMSALGVSTEATTGYYKTKWQAEELVRASDLDWTILRPSVIFDDRPANRHNFVGEIAKVIRSAPVIPILGSGTYRLQPVSLDDVSQTIVQSLAKPETIGKTYEIGGPDKLTYSEIVTTIAHAMHLKKPRVHIPFLLAEVAASLLGRFAFFPLTLDQLSMLRKENIVRDPEKELEWRSTFALPMKPFTVVL